MPRPIVKNRKLDSKGLPMGRPRAEEYVMRKAASIVATQKGKSDAMAKLRRAQAGKAELELKRKRGELIAFDRVEGMIEDVLTVLTQRLLAMPKRLAPRMAKVASSPREVEALLASELNSALSLTADSYAERAASLQAET